jgi:hypothetical protein
MLETYARKSSLINESPHKCPAIGVVLGTHQLMSVPSEVNIESWNKKHPRRRRHEVKKTVNHIKIMFQNELVRKQTRDIVQLHAVRQSHRLGSQKNLAQSNVKHTSSPQMILGVRPAKSS